MRLLVAVVVVVVVWVGFCRASEIAAVYLTQPTEIPFHLASRIYRAAFSPYPPTGISPSRTPPLPLSPFLTALRPSSAAFSR